VKCIVSIPNKANTETELYIANSFGNYQCYQSEYDELIDSKQVFLKYSDFKNGSIGEIAGVSNFNKTIFGMMPHPERNNEEFKKILYDVIFNTRQHPIQKTIRAEPTLNYNLISNSFKSKIFDLVTKKDKGILKEKINQLLNSEHISYKSTRKYLKSLYTAGDHVIQGPVVLKVIIIRHILIHMKVQLLG